VQERFEVHRHDAARPILSPEQVFLPPSDVADACKHYDRIDFQRYAFEQQTKQQHNFSTTAVPDIRINARSEDPALLLKQYLQRFTGHILITAESAGQREMLLELLKGFGIKPEVRENWQAFIEQPAALCITVSPIAEGLCLSDPDIAIITDQQILGKRTRQLSKSRRKREAEAVFADMAALQIGSPVVHEDHGVGRYLGLQTLHVNGYAEEFLTLEYAANDKLYVPVASLHLINRYTGGSEETAPLHRLGGEQWQKIKRKAAEKVRDVAAELLDIYARRAALPGHAMPMDEVEYEAFSSSFPFEETEDQATAIAAVVEDLRSEHPMDRVVCGDVGFGKTEVAMRAAFVAAQAGKQVAILSPTTLLAQQHFQNFRDRFADWPIRVELLSRFRSKKEIDDVISQLKTGKVDIVIGTHKILQDDVQYKNIGLLIIDEEHRFGVRHKEAIKSLKSDIDILTLTATPIPRTLNMALGGIREISLITTPPPDRLAIKTFVSQWSDTTIREACLREINRGGQVYFIHNRVEDIGRIGERLAALVPEANIRVGHGQMPERELENVMLDFYNRRFNLLLCTTIVESGLDVPTANTIIINRADRFGLAQLHQLRGRVGRSHHRAYAYLITPPPAAMTPDAIKRLDAIGSLEDLGSGFTLATHDLEIRGAGELLGDTQSGQIQEIGFSLYTDLLTRTVDAMKSGQDPDLDRPLNAGVDINLHLPALLPEDYVPDIHLRLVLYKRIASARSDDALRDLQVELIDRFGLLPNPAGNLLRIATIKLQAKALGINKIDASANAGYVRFGDKPLVDPLTVIRLIQNEGHVYRMKGAHQLQFRQDMDDDESRFLQIERLLDVLKPDAGAA